MARVIIFDNQFEKGLRKFKKKVLAEGLIQEIRERQHYIKPSEKRNRAKAAAKMRWRKKQKESNPQRDQEY